MEHSTPSTNQEIAYAQPILDTKKDGKEEEDRWTHVQTAQERTYARKYVNRFEAEMR